MANPKQFRNLIFNVSLGSALIALAIAFLLIVVATQPAQAQTYAVLHNFIGGQDGAHPKAGVTLNRGENIHGVAHTSGTSLPNSSRAGMFDNSLWIGTDNTSNRPVLNTDRAGNELRRVNNTEASGIAIDLATNLIYFGTAQPGQITGRNLNDPGTILVTLNPATSFAEDMAFDGAFLWRADYSTRAVDRIDPSTGNIVFSFSPGFTPLGVAWDGTNLWVSEIANNGLVEQFTTGGVPTGKQFNAPLGGKLTGGLAFDTNDSTLWIGTFGQVFHSTTTGVALGSFNVPVADGRFVDGLEFQGASPAPTFKVLHNFTGGQDGGNPIAGMTIRGGNLYGTASDGGTGYGTVYQLKHTGSKWIFNLLYSFTSGNDGANPAARVIFGPNGTLYGTTAQGGTYGYGTVFNLRPFPSVCKTALCPWMKTVLYAFEGGTDGAFPEGADVLFDQAGNIYGTTYNGGNDDGDGTVYELMPQGSGWTESVLYRFSGSDGNRPDAGLIFDPSGNLYGTTTVGGDLGCNVVYQPGCGTVYELTPSQSGWTENILYQFQNGNDGSLPYAGLIFDPSGNLYGATNNGGTGGGGTVFELTPSNGTWALKTLYSFTGTACEGFFGGGPWGTLFMDGGNLYGTTVCDGAYGYGTVFELTPSGGGWSYTSLHDFTGGSDGGHPIGNVVFDSGNLYGTAYDGGTGSSCSGGYGGYGCGVVWEITP